tara:strand:+ start:224 stop:508 length:285 start_codon:yes stop_codon:yes gene_type:complete
MVCSRDSIHGFPETSQWKTVSSTEWVPGIAEKDVEIPVQLSVLITIIEKNQINVRVLGQHQLPCMEAVLVLKVWDVRKFFLQQTKFIIARKFAA